MNWYKYIQKCLDKLYPYANNYLGCGISIKVKVGDIIYKRKKGKYTKWFYYNEITDKTESIHNNNMNEILKNEGKLILVINDMQMNAKVRYAGEILRYEFWNWEILSIPTDFLSIGMCGQCNERDIKRYLINKIDSIEKLPLSNKARKIVKYLSLDFYFSGKHSTICYYSNTSNYKYLSPVFKTVETFNNEFNIELVELSNTTSANVYRAMYQICKNYDITKIPKRSIDNILIDVFGSRNFQIDFKRSLWKNCKNIFIDCKTHYNNLKFLDLFDRSIRTIAKRGKKGLRNLKRRQLSRINVLHHLFQSIYKIYRYLFFESIIKYNKFSILNTEGVIIARKTLKKRYNFISDLFYALNNQQQIVITKITRLFIPMIRVIRINHLKAIQYIIKNSNSRCIICKKNPIHKDQLAREVSENDIDYAEYLRNIKIMSKQLKLKNDVKFGFICCDCFSNLKHLKNNPSITFENIRKGWGWVLEGIQ